MVAQVYDLDPENKRGRSAAIYASHYSWLVFPCHTRLLNGACSCGNHKCENVAKHPRTRQGLKDATLDQDQIKAWWRDSPGSNVAVVTGKVSGLVVVDIDPRNGGDESLQDLFAEFGKFPDTVTAMTGGGGMHYYFRYPKDVDKIRCKPIRDGIDIKADGGYVIAAPSVHGSGKEYGWEMSSRPGEVAVAELPDWLLSLLPIESAGAAAPGPKPEAAGKQVGVEQSFLGLAFSHAGWLGKSVGPDRHAVQCPWEADHTTGGPLDGSTVLFAPTAGKNLGWFHCSHSHCSTRTLDEVLDSLPADAKQYARNCLPGQSMFPKEAGTGWQHKLIRAMTKSGPGHVTSDLPNIVTILTCDERWRGVIGFDAFRMTHAKRKAPPWHPDDAPADRGQLTGIWLDADDTRTVSWLAREYGLRHDTAKIRKVIEMVAYRDPFHDVRDYLSSLRWDGIRRLESWIPTYLGAAASSYTAMVGQWWMRSAVARIFRPGCKVDHVLILEGEQGVGKSTALRLITGSDWFTDELPDLHNKDSYLQLRGKWVIEMSELDTLSRADAGRAKSFFTSSTDTYRAPYGHTTVDVPRQCVFAGSVNHDAYLRDETGNRRYWPVKVAQIDLEALARDRDQLWAEAYAQFSSGDRWHPEKGERPVIAEQQEERFAGDEWESTVARWLTSSAARRRPFVTLGEVLLSALSIEPGKWTRPDQTRVGVILMRLGWTKRREREHLGGPRVWVYFPPPSVAALYSVPSDEGPAF
jgi:predicted P-loop ATPase